jgi:hypothetical protein
MVDGIAEHIDHATEQTAADGHLERVPGIDDGAASGQSRRQGKRYAPHPGMAEVTDDLEDGLPVVTGPQFAL